MAAHQAPPSLGFSRREHWSGLPCLPPGHLHDPGIEHISLMSSALAGRFFTTSIPWGGPNITVIIELISCVQLFTTHGLACQASLSITISQSCSDSCPLSQWCHPNISSSVTPFSSWPQSFPASGSFPMLSMSVLLRIQHYLCYCGFIAGLRIWQCHSSSFILLLQNCFTCCSSFIFLYKF